MRREEVLRNHWFLAKRWGRKRPWHRICRGKIGRLFKCHMTGVFTMILTSIRQHKMRWSVKRGQAWYRTQFYLEEDASLVSVRLLFDGVYMNAQVHINGQVLGYYPNGYTLFLWYHALSKGNDRTANQLAVFVENQQPSSRWYSGKRYLPRSKIIDYRFGASGFIWD